MIEGYDYRITWDAPSYEHTEHTADWFWAVGIISLSLAIAFLIMGNALLSIIILLGVSLVLFYAKHPPKTATCSLSKRGIHYGETVYPWKTLESFCILDEYDDHSEVAIPKIVLTSKKPFMPHIIVPLNEEVFDEVHQALWHMLPEEVQPEPFLHKVSRKIGF